jgi:hypothetical protein
MRKSELFEAIPFELKEVKEVEHNGERLMQVRGVMHRANERNGNNRIYPAPILSREVQKLKERLSSGDTVFSQTDHPADGVSRIGDTAAMLKSVEYTPENEVIGTAVILPTQKGKDLAAIVRAGGKVVITVRGFGTTRPGEWQGVQGGRGAGRLPAGHVRLCDRAITRTPPNSIANGRPDPLLIQVQQTHGMAALPGRTGPDLFGSGLEPVS